MYVQNAIEKGVARAGADSPGDKAAVIVSALTNVAVMLNDRVAGRICIEIDPRLANNKGDLHYQSCAANINQAHCAVVRDAMLRTPHALT